MTTVQLPPDQDELTVDAEHATSPMVESNGTDEAGPQTVDLRQVVLTCVAAFLAGSAAAWMLAGAFEGSAARVLAPIGPAVGALLVVLSYRFRRPSTIQWATIPVAIALGAAVTAVDRGGSADLARLVTDALFSGGLGQPPVPFDPGWRFLLPCLTVALTAGAASTALGYERTNLAVGVPALLVIGGTLIQPPGVEVLSTVVALTLLVGALAVAYGVELARSGISSGRFELARLARGAGALAALAGGLVLLAASASFLLPDASADQVIPPQRPPTGPPQADRLLFTVETDRSLPWRLGVLDVYEDGAWKTPPFDPARLVDLPTEATDIPDAVPADETVTVTFQIAELGGRVLPTLAVPQSLTVTSGEGVIQYDPRTQTLRSSELVDEGFTYTVTAAIPATTNQLLEAPPPPEAMDEFLSVPPPPPAVRDLLDTAPTDNLFARLQYVREQFYDNVIAAGAGDPVDVPPERVAEILGGDPASPFEITAAEALLARWAGIPSRLGYGYFGGVESGDDLRDIRPAHGSTYLEVYFEDAGWTPIVGKPPRAQSSFTDSQKNEDESVRPTDELALITYVPIRLQSLTLLFEVVRYYLLQVVPAILAVVGLIMFYPGLLRSLRRRRRSRWAERHGAAGRIAVAYAQLRDEAWDLNIGHPSQTPLEFVGEIADDAEHRELAWLVTRSLWGDLARDLQDADAHHAEELAVSVRRRLRGAQTTVTRVLAVSSRASLRDPYSDDMPNAWWELALGRRVRDTGRTAIRRLRDLRPRGGRRLRRLVARGGTSAAVLVLALALLAVSCTKPLDLATPSDPTVLPDPAVPTRLDDLVLQREPSAEVPFAEGGPDALVTTGQVYTVRRDDTIEASLQLGAFRPGLYGHEDEIQRGILGNLGGGRFEPIRLGDERVDAIESAEQRLLLWFSPNGRYYVLLVARKVFADADALFEAVLAHQRGLEVTGLGEIVRNEAPDPRKGFSS